MILQKASRKPINAVPMFGSRCQWSLAAVTSVSAILLAFVFISPFAGVQFVRHWGYFIILAAFIAFCASLVQAIKKDRNGTWRTLDRTMAAIAAIAALLWQFQEPHGFKILMDELVLNATAMSMHFDREVFVPLKAHDVDGLYIVLGGLLDKRPIFFPFLLSLVHDLSGYRPENAFVLNGVLAFALLLTTGILASVVGRTNRAGILAILLMAGLPLLSLNATGGGFDLLNLVMIVAVALFGIRYLEEPTPIRQNNLVLATVLLAQTRYESALFVGATGVIIVIVWFRNRAPIFSWSLIVAPLLLITIPLQNKVFEINPGYWQAEGSHAPFHISYFSDNLGHAANFLFTVDGFSTGSIILSIAGVICTVFALVFLIRRPRQTIATSSMLIFAIAAIAILANVGLLFCYFWGQLDDYVATRLALPLMLLFSLSCAFVLGRWIRSDALWLPIYAIATIWILGWAIPTSSSARGTRAFLSYQEIEWERKFVATARDSAFFVMQSSLPAITLRRATIPIEVLAERARELKYHLKEGTYDSVYVFQRLTLDPESKKFEVADGYKLGPEFILESVEERRLKPLYAMRLSRIIDVDLARALPKPPDWRPRFPPFKIIPAEQETPAGTYVREYLDNLP